VGDVNGDEVDDYLLQYGLPGGTNMDSRIVLYYGSTNFPEVDSLVISDNTNAITVGYSSPLGDLNNDGYADFETYVGKVWLGGTALTPVNELELVYRNPPYHDWFNPGRNVGTPFIYGDLNGDGYDDVIGSTNQINYYRGEVGIWIGGPNMDGFIDLYLYPPSDYQSRNFGYAKAAGDFNGDGLCDIAVSAPMWGQGTEFDTTGRVFIFAGNTALSDPVVANDDLVEDVRNWDIRVYPNPIRINNHIQIELVGNGCKSQKPISVELYNIKGQQVSNLDCYIEPTTGNSISMPIPNIANGLYILKLRQNNDTAITKRICILK
jgi:hypothetical protein